MTKRHYVVIAISVAAGLLLVGWLLFKCPGSGFGVYTSTVDVDNRAKTLWDWMDLLLVPLFLAGGAWWLNRQARAADHEIALDRQRESALQMYLDRMTELLLKEG